MNSHLKIVPYDPDDYSLGSVFAAEHGSHIEKGDLASNALSLYFQWPEHRSARLYHSNDNGEVTTHSCELNYDRDERLPTEIWIKLKDSKKIFAKEFTTITVRFEVFQACYEFDCTVLAISNESEDWQIISSVPETMKVFKWRTLPRYDVSNIDGEKTIQWISADRNTSVNVKFVELSLNSIKILDDPHIKESAIGYLKIVEELIPAEVLKVSAGHKIIRIKPETGFQAGVFFDFAKNLIYPYLRSRKEVAIEDVLKLYKESNYLSKYSSEKEITELNEAISALWKGTESANHHVTADYFAVDQMGVLSGASSATLSFYSNEIPIWMLHQTCAIKSPELLEQTSSLYASRIEYLSARPEELKAAVVFDSRSRWHERIYVKFSSIVGSRATLGPVKITKCTEEASTSTDTTEFKTYNIGSFKRITTQTETIWGGFGPKYLNAAGNLDEVIQINTKEPIEKLIKTAKEILRASNTSSSSLRYVTSPHISHENLNGVLLPSDRLCVFAKSDLISLLNSIKHSVAITKRKFNERNQ